MPPAARFLLLGLMLAITGQASAASKSRSAAGKPNILFIMAYDLRDYAGWMGMRFDNAHCNSALSNPSRVSLLTGMLPSSSGVIGNEQDWRRSIQVAGKPTLPQYFKEQGYLTVAGGKIFPVSQDGRTSFEPDAAWSQRLPVQGDHVAEKKDAEAAADGGQMTAFAADFLSQKQPQPFFLALGLNPDATLGRVLEVLEKGPNAKNTIIVFCSDHGSSQGEKSGLSESATRVLLTMRVPEITRPDTASTRPVSLIDLYPTLCDLAKLPLPDHLDGTSLKSLLLKPAAKREKPAIICAENGSFAARDDHWRYIRHGDGSEELYDHQTDSTESTNLAGKPEHAAEKSRLSAFLPKEIKSAVRTLAEIVAPPSPANTNDLALQIGDVIPVETAPKLQGRGFFISAAFDFDPAVDHDSTLLAQGDEQSGYALHFVAAQPTLTLFADGKETVITGAALEKGRVNLRASLDGDALSLAVPGHSEVFDVAPFDKGFPQEPKSGIAVGQSFGILKAAKYPNSTPFDGACHRLHLTLLPAPVIPAPAEAVKKAMPAATAPPSPPAAPVPPPMPPLEENKTTLLTPRKKSKSSSSKNKAAPAPTPAPPPAPIPN